MINQIYNAVEIGDLNVNTNIDIIQEKPLDNANKNKKGRKVDEVRNFFIIENNYLKCAEYNCNKKFSCNTSVSVLKYHLMQDHGKNLNKKTNTKCIITNMENDIQTSNAEIYKAFAIAFAKNSLPHSLIEDKFFKNALYTLNNKAISLNKKNMRDIILIEGEKINEKLLTNLALNKIPVTLALDGWTNIRSNKVTNVLLIVNGTSYFIGSIENESNKNNAEWLTIQLEEKIKSLLLKQINIIAIAADNEKLMKSVCKNLKIKFPLLIHVPCAAHIIQLCFKKICGIETIKTIISNINNIIYLIRNIKENRNKLFQLQINENIDEPLKILYHCEVRWTSLIISIERIIYLKKYIIEILKDSNNQKKLKDLNSKINEEFWNNLSLLYDFLKLFKLCTNQIQKDDATLYSVWENFNKLIDFYSTFDSSFTNDKNLIVEIIKNKWNEHINVQLIDVTRLLNFEQNYKINDNSLKFIEEWGSEYLTTYSIVNNKNIDIIKPIIYLQISEFLSRQKEFANIDSIVNNLKKACEIQNTQYSAKLTWGRFSASHFELSKIAIAILSICPTEAAVERSFSALSDIHTEDRNRNRLSNNIIEAELKIKWNLNNVCSEIRN